MKGHAHQPAWLAGFLKAAMVWLLALCWAPASAQDLAEIRERGVLRHLGVPYARFVSGGGGGFDVELVQRFARHIGVRYEYVPAEWTGVIQDLIGQELEYKPTMRAVGSRPIRGDIIANGMTILPPRQKVIDYSEPTFPSAVWLLARADSPIQPIKPSGDLQTDIRETKKKLSLGKTYVMDNSCLDPRLYDIEDKGYPLHRFTESTNLNDIVPAVVKGEGEMSLLDVPDLIVAMEKWNGQIKVIGPISEPQLMGAGFRKTSPALRQAFDEFVAQLQKSGAYMSLVKKYYRAAPRYHPEFFQKIADGR
ncbi:MAG: transporter substrate-binding domain-containing protein [Propionivibrio sp.]